jgi:hypothetical protein
MFAEKRNGRHRMPIVFGPTPGPRAGEFGQAFDYSDAPRHITSVGFLTDGEALSRFLPPFCELDGEPVVTVEHVVLDELAWLAGRSYSLLSVKYPVVYRGPAETVRGSFLSVLWENLADPIISGREELGFAKLYCELPTRTLAGFRAASASWDGHTFLKMEVSNLCDSAPPPAAPVDGVIHHRYLPQVGSLGVAEVEQMVLSPTGGVQVRRESYQTGKGSIAFAPSTWEQLPTMHHIVNALASLPVLEVRTAYFERSRGAKDLSDQRILR